MKSLKTFSLYLFSVLIFSTIGWFGNTLYHLPRSADTKVPIVRPTPLAKYTIENLSKTEFNASEITIDDNIFSFLVDGKKITGEIRIPDGDGPFPVIVMFRGYIDQKTYKTGDGTRRAAEVFAKNGFITIAPDFLGYGGSDAESSNIFESRFQTHVTAASLLSSVYSLRQWDGKNIFIWGHSNGGQVALTTLETTGINYPTVLWAPVSKPFPYSVLYYTDDSDDRGKLIRSELSKFETDYDVEKFSLTNYLGNIKAEIQLNQGANDDAVPVSWSDLLNKNLKVSGVTVEYLKYPGADHNMQPAWSKVVVNSLNFFKNHLQ